MDDDEAVARVASDYLARWGPAVLAHLLDMEAIARSLGDELSADAWLDIARSAAEQMDRARRG
jgi:hypothetical protein